MSIGQASFLRDRAYQTVALTHFFVDVLNSSRTVLIALIAVSIGLTNAQVGLALLLYNLGSALSQPFFGALADRYGPRAFVFWGMAWMVGLYGLATLGDDWLALLAITLAGLGSGSVHPAGTKVASESSDDARTQATGIFFASGQTGLFIGPIAAGFLLQELGRPGYLILPLLAFSALISGWRWLMTAKDEPQATPISQPIKQVRSSQSTPWRTVLPLLVIIMTSSTIGIATINFAPKLFTELGYGMLYVGWMPGLFMLGSAVGGILGGSMADRIGRRPAILTGMIGCMAPILLYIPAADPWRFLLLLVAGFFAGMPHSVLVIMAQALLPGRRAFASGLTLGLMFFSGAIGTYILGIVADEIGLETALRGIIFLPIAAAAMTLLLPARDHFPSATIVEQSAD